MQQPLLAAWRTPIGKCGASDRCRDERMRQQSWHRRTAGAHALSGLAGFWGWNPGRRFACPGLSSIAPLAQVYRPGAVYRRHRSVAAVGIRPLRGARGGCDLQWARSEGAIGCANGAKGDSPVQRAGNIHKTFPALKGREEQAGAQSHTHGFFTGCASRAATAAFTFSWAA